MRQRTKHRDPGLDAAIQKARTLARLAELITSVTPDDPITTQGVGNWDRCPSTRCLVVEQVTGVSRYRLRPDIFGDDPKSKGKRPKSQDALRVA
jgi:DNA-binding transcriptional regulator YdaS (Cro superfamily)